MTATNVFTLACSTMALLVVILILLAVWATQATKRRNARYSRMAAAVDETLREASLATLVGHVRAEAIRKGHEVRDSQCRYHDPSLPDAPSSCLTCYVERASWAK